ncbi:ER membrane protein complex subunit 10 [Tachypleus tridentatus]|uniref:ER membrane protein complex subunit 10 n=1 Tax=Tachypleus tridentatus TaxID=6853 RepID=UPI003FD0A6A8
MAACLVQCATCGNSISIWLRVIVLIIILNSVSVVLGQDGDGQLVLYMDHSLDQGATAEFTPRGVITVHSLRSGDVSWNQENTVNSLFIEQLKQVSRSGGYYRLKLSTKQNYDNFVMTFMNACSLYESALSDIITITFDQGGALLGVSATTVPSICQGSVTPDSRLAAFNSTVYVVSTYTGPSPDTATYIQRLEKEKAEKARGENQDNRSFLAKYWMYIVPLLIFVLLSGSSEQGGR